MSEKLFRSGCNCAQSVIGAFAEEAGISLEQAMLLASPFGAGIGKLRGVCGAVTGMIMAAGLIRGYSSPTAVEGKKAIYKLTQDMIHEFKKLQGSMICRELLGLKEGEDLEEPAVRTEQYYQERPCLRAVRCGAQIAENYLLLNPVHNEKE